MPTYQYRRPDGSTFEVFQKISDPALVADPETGVPVHRVISGGAGLQFKGSGFYLTDYARAGSGGTTSGREGGSGDAKRESKSEGKSGTTTEATPATSESKATPAKD